MGSLIRTITKEKITTISGNNRVQPRSENPGYAYAYDHTFLVSMQCCLAIRIPSVCLSHACIVTKRKKDLSTFIYHTKDHLA